jgi:hypothetical protein
LQLEKKLAARAPAEGVELGQVARARCSVRPDGKLQELSDDGGFLARYGPAVLDDFAGHIAAWHAGALEGAAPDHRLDHAISRAILLLLVILILRW